MIVDPQWFRAEQELLLGRLRSVEAGYSLNSRCMDGTRQSILNRIMAWVASPQETNKGPWEHTYWFYGSPGIGKTSLAHSICQKLHDRQQFAGAFFCRRDDPHLSELANVIPTLINALAGILPPFRRIVADRLRKDRNLTSKTMKDTLFLDFIRNLPRHPEHTLVFVIDAFDECGHDRSRPGLLKVLTDAAGHTPWLKVIITSRPEADIQRFFYSPTRRTHLRYDLAEDQDASADLQAFARSELDLVASKYYLDAPWPEESLFNRIIGRANGLFIFIKTLVLSLDSYKDPSKSLEAALRDSGGTGLNSLYALYYSILEARVKPKDTKFQRMVGVILITAPYRALCEDTVAELVGVRPNLIRKLVDDLGSLLYRDEGANGAIRVRHLSISDFFVDNDCNCDYQVSVTDANLHLGMACLKTMVDQLCFNICKLEDSRLANANVKDLQSRIKQNISDSLQYSSLYWSNHLCLASNIGDQRVWVGLKEFFEGMYPIFWIEVLSVMGMVPIGAPSLRRVISWVKVSTPSSRHVGSKVIVISCRISIQHSSREFRISVVSSSPSTPPSQSALHTPIFQHGPSYHHIHLYRRYSIQGLLGPSRYKKGNY